MKQLSDNEHFDLVVPRQMGQRVAEWNDDYEYIMTHGDLRQRLTALQRLRSDVLQYAPGLGDGRQYDYTLFFWSKLNYSLQRLEQRLGYLSAVAPEAAAPQAVEPKQPAAMPHFGLDDRCDGHWADVYHRLCAMKCFDSREVTVGDFRYVCCGKGEPPAAPLVWRGATNMLAYIVRHHMGHAWATARACFTLAGKPLPASFVNTQSPKSQKVRDKVDQMFGKIEN